MDLPGCFGSFRPPGNRPGAYFVLTGGQKCNQIEQSITNLNNTIRTQFWQPKRFQVLGSVLLRQFSKLGFKAGGNCDHFGSFSFRSLSNFCNANEFTFQFFYVNIIGCSVSRKSSFSTVLSCASNSILLTRFKLLRDSCKSRSTSSSCWYFLSPDFAALVVRSMRRSTVARSVKASSAFRLSRSRLGSISP